MAKVLEIFRHIIPHLSYKTNQESRKSVGNLPTYNYFLPQLSFERFCCQQLMSEKWKMSRLEAFTEVLTYVTWLEIMWHIKKFNWHKQTSTTLELQPHYTMRPLSVDKLNIVISRLHSSQTTCQILVSALVPSQKFILSISLMSPSPLVVILSNSLQPMSVM